MRTRLNLSHPKQSVKQRDVSRLSPVQTLAKRQMRTALAYLTRDCRALMPRAMRARFDQITASDNRYCPTDDLVEMLSIAQRHNATHEDFVAFCDELRAVGDAMWAPSPVVSIPDLLRAETQAQGVSDIAAHEAMANPECPSTLRRCAETLRHHARKAWDAATGMDMKAARASREWAS